MNTNSPPPGQATWPNARPYMPQPTRILLLERDPDLRKSITLSLRQNGMQVLEAHNDTEAFEILHREPRVTLLILDRDSAQPCGPLIQAYREKTQPQGNVLLIVMERLEDQWRQKFQPDAVVYKPFDIRYLYRRVQHLV